MTDRTSDNTTLKLLLSEVQHLRQQQIEIRAEQKESMASLRQDMKEEVGKLQRQQDSNNAAVDRMDRAITRWHGGGLVLAGLGAFGLTLLAIWEKLVKIIAN